MKRVISVMDIQRLNSNNARKKYCDEIRLFIEYGVVEQERKTALKTLDSYEANSMALIVEKSVYIGEKSEGIADSEVLQFFGYNSNEDFLKKIDNEEESNSDIGIEQEAFCPACAVAQGEFHELGCPVEICPWCDGQLNYCNCRFEKLGVDEIVDEAEIDRLEILLNDKGRVPFSADHAPAYPSAGDDN